MNYRPNLIFQPCYYSYGDILHAFEAGKPLKPEQLNFLLWHARQLSGTHLDPVLKYYKIGEKHHHYPGCIHSFLIADELNSQESSIHFREKLETLLRAQHHGVMVRFTGEQLSNFMTAQQIPHVIYFDNNKLVVESPIFRGKRVHAYFFQVGDIVGIIRYELVKDAPLSETDALVYFEELHKRELTEYIHEFYRKYNEDIELLKKQQAELQETLEKIQLDRHQQDKDALKKDLQQVTSIEQNFLDHQQKFTETPQYKILPEDEVLRDHLLQQSLEFEKQLQNESSEAELAEIETADAKIIEEKHLKDERIRKHYVEQYIAYQNLLEQKRIENDIRKTKIPDLHQFQPSTTFPPRYELKLEIPTTNKKEEK